MPFARPSSWRILIFTVFVIALIWLVVSPYFTLPSGLGSGTAAPEFAVTDVAGQRWESKTLRGQVVVLDFWATWCDPCVSALPSMKELYQRLAVRPRLLFLGVSLDSDVDKFREFLGSQEIGWPQICDGRGADTFMAEAFRVKSIPQIFVIDARGVVRFRNLAELDLEAAVEQVLEEDPEYAAWKKEHVPVQQEFEKILYQYRVEAEPLLVKNESMLRRLKDPERTKKYLEIVADPYEKMARKLEEFIAKHPGSPWAYRACFMLGRYYLDTGQAARGVERAEEAIRGEAHLLYSAREDIYYLLAVLQDIQQNPGEVRRLAGVYAERYPEGRFRQGMDELVKRLPREE